MRELLFRAWDEHTKTFVYIDLRQRPPSINMWQSDDLQQYTGLKDVNGQEIYEGDLLGSRRYTGSAEVVWHGAGFANKWEVTSKITTNTRFSPLTDKDIFEYESVVIGSIYQTPELLQVQP